MKREISPFLKQVLEIGPVIVFMAAFFLLREKEIAIMGLRVDGLVAATLIFVPVMLFACGVLWGLTGSLSTMQIVTLVLLVLFGGLTIWFNDERFIKMKPTLIYLIFAGVLGFGLMQGRSYLQAVMDQGLPLEGEGWMILTRRVCLFFLVLAGMNEVIWRLFSDALWVFFKFPGMPILTAVFFAAQYKIFQEYAPPDEVEDDQNSG